MPGERSSATKAALYARAANFACTVFGSSSALPRRWPADSARPRRSGGTSGRGIASCLAEVSGCVLRSEALVPVGRQPRSQRHSIHRSQQCCSRSRKWSDLHAPVSLGVLASATSWAMLRLLLGMIRVQCRSINWFIRGNSEFTRTRVAAASSRWRLRSSCFDASALSAFPEKDRVFQPVAAD